jgi:hypothetical protein
VWDSEDSNKNSTTDYLSARSKQLHEELNNWRRRRESICPPPSEFQLQVKDWSQSASGLPARRKTPVSFVPKSSTSTYSPPPSRPWMPPSASSPASDAKRVSELVKKYIGNMRNTG